MTCSEIPRKRSCIQSVIIVSNIDFIAGFMMAKVDVKCPFCAQTASVKKYGPGVQGTSITAVRHVAAAFRSTMNTAPVSPA